MCHQNTVSVHFFQYFTSRLTEKPIQSLINLQMCNCFTTPQQKPVLCSYTTVCPVYLIGPLRERERERRLVFSTINIRGWGGWGECDPPHPSPSQGWPPRTPLWDWPPMGQEIEEERRERKGVISLAKLPTGLMRETNQRVRVLHQEANITAHLLD